MTAATKLPILDGHNDLLVHLQRAGPGSEQAFFEHGSEGHIDYLAGRIGTERVAIGSDFDGAVIPEAIGDAAGLPRLIDALRAHSYDEEALRKLACDNWLRVLRATWRE